MSFGSDVSTMTEVFTGSDTTYTSEEELSDNSEYYWFVTATDQSGATFSTTIHSFTVNSDNDLPSDFALLAPENGSMVTDLTPTLLWEEPSDADDVLASSGLLIPNVSSIELNKIKNVKTIKVFCSLDPRILKAFLKFIFYLKIF